jgi:DNA-binding GntR family transcriptional regulator
MNANELDFHSLIVRLNGAGYYEAATMLRQQQAELDAFKLQYYNTGYSIQLRDKDETIRQQQAEIEALKKKIQNMALDLLSAHAKADDHWVELERLRKASEK